MSSKIADDKILVKCHAGCEVDEVCRALGIRQQDLFARSGHTPRDPKSANRPRDDEPPEPLPRDDALQQWAQHLASSDVADRLIERRGWSVMTITMLGLGLDDDGRIVIPLRDAHGRLQTVERYDPEATGSAPKTIALKGRKRHLLLPPGGLNEVAEIIVAEGAGDAISALSRRLVAVGAPSATIWRDEYSEVLAAAGTTRALVAFDCDGPGRKGARRVAESLAARGISAHIVGLDPARSDGYDLTDWLLERPDPDAAALLDELRSLAQRWQNDSLSATPGDHRFELVAPNLGDVRAIEWAWSARIVIGLFNLLVGEEGAGKGSLAAWIIARLTKGELDGDLHGVPSRVIIGGDEDDFDRVWTPRLHVAGADLALLRQVRGQSGESLTFPSGIATLRALVEDFGARFVFFDALLDNLDPDVNPDRAKHVRSALMPLRALARDLDVAIVGAVHTNKTRGNFRQSISGSHQFNGVSKSSLIVAKHPEGPEERRVVASGKGNYSRRPTSLEFKIEGRSPRIGGVEIKTSVAVDFVSSPLTADDLSAAAKPEATSKAAQAREYIAQQLDDHEPHDAGPIIAHLKDMLGLDDRAIRKAREAVDAVSEAKPEYQGGHAWRLPRPHEQFTRLGRDGRDGDARMSANAVRADSSRDTE